MAAISMVSPHRDDELTGPMEAEEYNEDNDTTFRQRKAHPAASVASSVAASAAASAAEQRARHAALQSIAKDRANQLRADPSLIERERKHNDDQVAELQRLRQEAADANARAAALAAATEAANTRAAKAEEQRAAIALDTERLASEAKAHGVDGVPDTMLCPSASTATPSADDALQHSTLFSALRDLRDAAKAAGLDSPELVQFGERPSPHLSKHGQFYSGDPADLHKRKRKRVALWQGEAVDLFQTLDSIIDGVNEVAALTNEARFCDNIAAWQTQTGLRDEHGFKAKRSKNCG